MGEEEGQKLERECERGELVMDTPERGRIATPFSKFEDSPVFSYICNLSPLEAVRPIRISQSFNSYSLSSIPSIFTSPQVSLLKETKFLKWHSISDPSNQELSSENRNKICSNAGFVDVSHKSEEQKESFDPGGYTGKTFNNRKFENDVPQTHNYDSLGPNDSTVTCRGIDPECSPSALGGSSSSLVPFGLGGPTSGIISTREQNTEEGSLDWVKISDDADFLIFESPNNANPFEGSFLKPLDSEMRFHVSEKTQADVLVGDETIDTQNTLHRTDKDQLDAVEATGDVLSYNCLNNEATRLNNQATEVSNEVNADKSSCNLPRGIRRRCLVFDVSGARRKFQDDGSNSSSSMLSSCHVISNENQPIPSKPDNNSSRCIVPGIGLHLNALARTSNNYTANNDETLAAPRQLIHDISANAASDSLENNQDIINQSLALNSVDGDVGLVDGGLRGTEDAYQLSVYLGNDDLNQGCPKKRRKLENGETDSCKRCNCKKSKCLKLYCECFAAGVYCVDPCSCQDCFNKPIHEDTVLATRKQIESRNPLAFAPKVIRTTEFLPETADDSSSTPASARHKRGCNCKKSGCLKKYCECYQGGVGCSINCRCEGCKNAFGRKDGSHIILAEAEVEETDIHEKSVVDRSLSKHIIQSNADQTPETAMPETPMHCGWTPLQHPFSSKRKPPKSLLSTGSSSLAPYGGQKFGIPLFLQPQPEFEKRVLNNSEDEIPEILRSPTTGIKSSSPNGKRVSPPHCNFEASSSPTRRASRKLILRLIPSFPSLKD